MNVPRTTTLRPDQQAWPILWSEARGPLTVPDAGDVWVVPHFGTAIVKSSRLVMWGHDDLGTFYIACRGGTALHTDPGYIRYSHQLIIRNDGWRLHGMEVRPSSDPLMVGTFYCLDTHSPHQVAKDPRLGTGLYWLALVIDNDVPLTPEVAWLCLAPRLQEAHV